MMIFAVTFTLFVVVFLAMAIGYIIQRKRIRGSCGGLDALGIEKECDCPEPCDEHKMRLIETISEPGQSPNR